MSVSNCQCPLAPVSVPEAKGWAKMETLHGLLSTSLLKMRKLTL